jgi:hypothetical protein
LAGRWRLALAGAQRVDRFVGHVHWLVVADF